MVANIANGRKDLLADDEMQNWRREMADSMEAGGMGIKGVPGGENSKVIGIHHLLA